MINLGGFRDTVIKMFQWHSKTTKHNKILKIENNITL